jgi:hypothetical protein
MADEKMINDAASDGLAVAPPSPGGPEAEREASAAIGAGDGNEVRAANDATTNRSLAADPSDEDAKLDVALDETFPTSDPPSNTQPGKGKDPAPATGFDPDAEAALIAGKE